LLSFPSFEPSNVGATGATVSITIDKALLTALTFPASSVAFAMTKCVPSANAVDGVIE
jgi:hypothetical protein